MLVTISTPKQILEDPSNRSTAKMMYSFSKSARFRAHT